MFELYYLSKRNTNAFYYRRLDSNLLTCDCDILWLVNVLKKSHTSGEELGEFTATCHFPIAMSGKSLMEMTEDDFHCSE